MRECNWTQEDNTDELGVTVRTIQRLEKEARRQNVGKDTAPLRSSEESWFWEKGIIWGKAD